MGPALTNCVFPLECVWLGTPPANRPRTGPRRALGEVRGVFGRGDGELGDATRTAIQQRQRDEARRPHAGAYGRSRSPGSPTCRCRDSFQGGVYDRYKAASQTCRFSLAKSPRAASTVVSGPSRTRGIDRFRPRAHGRDLG